MKWASADPQALAMAVIENYDKAGIPNLLPELAISKEELGLPGYVDQKEFDREVEGAYSFLIGEISRWLEERNK